MHLGKEMLNKIFQEENKYYRFYILLPMYLWLEMSFGVILTQGNIDVIYIWQFFSVICILTSGIMGLVYYGIHNKFLRQFNALTEEQKKSIAEYGIARCFKVYLSKDFLIRYGMFTKRIIRIDEIESIQRNNGIRVMQAGGYRVSEDVDQMILMMKSGKMECVDTSDDMMKAITALQKGDLAEDFYNKNIYYYVDEPVEGMTALFLLGSVILFWGGYSHVMNLFVAKSDSVFKMLFVTGYENRFYMGAALMTGISIISTFVWRFRAQSEKNHISMMPLWGGIALVIIMLTYGEYDNKFDEDIQTARVDYQLYQEGVCEQVIASRMTIVEDSYAAWGSTKIYRRIDAAGMEMKFLEIEIDESLSSQEDAQNKFILVNPKWESWEEEKTYRIQYLKNTRIVTNIEEVDL